MGAIIFIFSIIFLFFGLISPSSLSKFIKFDVSRIEVFLLSFFFFIFAVGYSSAFEDKNKESGILVFSVVCLSIFFLQKMYRSINKYEGNNILEKLTNFYKERKEESDRIKAIEEAKIQKILSGKIEPITISITLEKDEKAYIKFNADRRAIVETIKQYTEGKSKKTGGLTRALVGGVLLGPVGAIIGAVTAGSKHTEVTKERREQKIEVIDSGFLIFTNKRIIFRGDKNIKALKYQDIISTKFSYNGEDITFQYEGMLNGEEYRLRDDNYKYSKVYFKGITENLLRK